MATTDSTGEEGHKLVSVRYGFGYEVSAEEKKAKGITDNDFIEVRVESSTPNIVPEKIDSPADKVLQVLKEKGIAIKLL